MRKNLTYQIKNALFSELKSGNLGKKEFYALRKQVKPFTKVLRKHAVLSIRDINKRRVANAIAEFKSENGLKLVNILLKNNNQTELNSEKIAKLVKEAEKTADIKTSTPAMLARYAGLNRKDMQNFAIIQDGKFLRCLVIRRVDDAPIYKESSILNQKLILNQLKIDKIPEITIRSKYGKEEKQEIIEKYGRSVAVPKSVHVKDLNRLYALDIVKALKNSSYPKDKMLTLKTVKIMPKNEMESIQYKRIQISADKNYCIDGKYTAKAGTWEIVARNLFYSTDINLVKKLFK